MFCRLSPASRCLELRVRLQDTRNWFGGVYHITNQSEVNKILMPQRQAIRGELNSRVSLLEMKGGSVYNVLRGLHDCLAYHPDIKPVQLYLNRSVVLVLV